MRAQQHAHRLAAPGVSGGGAAAWVKAPAEAGNGRFKEILRELSCTPARPKVWSCMIVVLPDG